MVCKPSLTDGVCGQLYGGWPVGATSDQIRAGQVTNGQHPQSTGFGQNYGGTTNNLERHDTGVCGESDNGLGKYKQLLMTCMNHAESCWLLQLRVIPCSDGSLVFASVADATGTKTNQCFGGTDALFGGASSTMGKHITGWGAALQICQDVGARLCTVEELLAENTRNTGCNHDCQMVWSSQTHTTCGADHHVAAQGGLNCAYMVKSTGDLPGTISWTLFDRLRFVYRSARTNAARLSTGTYTRNPPVAP